MAQYIIEALNLSRLDWEPLRPFLPEGMDIPTALLSTADNGQTMWTRWESIKESKLKLSAAKATQ
jgi:hypothetical protein